MVLTVTEWKTLIQNKINVLLNSAGSTYVLDFVVGSVADTISMSMAYLVETTWAFYYEMVDQAFVYTARGTWLQRHANTFGVPISAGTKATGSVTFSRIGSTGSLTIPSATGIGTSSETVIGVAFVTDAIATIPNGSTNVTTTVTAAEFGDHYNVEAGTIRYLVSPVVGISSVTNATATSGGVDVDTNTTLRNKILDYIQNIGKATLGALNYRAGIVTGVEDISILQRPFGMEILNIDLDLFTYTGTWTTGSDNNYYWGEYTHTTTDTDYCEFYCKGNNYVVPTFGQTVSPTLCEVFLDGVSKYEFDTSGDGNTVDGLRVELPDTNTHIIKLVKKSGSDLIVDSMKVYSNERRLATIDVYVNDGSGSASWDLLKLVKTAVNSYKAAGIEAFIKRSEIYTIDITIGVSWTNAADKDTAKSNIESDISEYLTIISSGGTIYLTNLYQFIAGQTINGVAQVDHSIIQVPSVSIVLAENEIARIGTVVFYEL